MNKKLVALVTAAAMVSSSCSTLGTKTIEQDRGVASVTDLPEALREIAYKGANYNFSNQGELSKESAESVLSRIATGPNLPLAEGKVITSNDEAFQHKLDAVRGATKSIDLSYYIYSNDDSSSVFNKALIEKAQSGVKVRLMVDFITNGANMDIFSMLKREGKGNIEIYFYNVPSDQLVWDFNYMSMECPKDESTGMPRPKCQDYKTSKMGKMWNGGPVAPTAFSKMLMAGIYLKSATALKVALGFGAQISVEEIAKLKGDPNSPSMTKEQMHDLGQIFIDAFVHNSIIAKIKLYFVMQMYGDQLDPILNEITGRVPLALPSPAKKPTREQIWQHFSDYTHHKLILVDDEVFELGGRNIEDSYHVEQRVPREGDKKQKYIFMDTDFWGRAKNKGDLARIRKGYESLIGSSMVKTIDQVKNLMAVDFVMNAGVVLPNKHTVDEMAVGSCLIKGVTGECVLGNLPKIPGFQSEDARASAQVAIMNANANRYETQYRKGSRNNFGLPLVKELSSKDMQSAKFYYLENFNYDRKNIQNRKFGAVMGFEDLSGKNIQVASHLLKYCHYHEDVEGEKMELRFLKDTSSREVDFVVVKNKKPLFAVECKTGEKQTSKSILYFKERLSIPVYYQTHLGEADYRTKDGVRIIPFVKLCKELNLI